MSFMSLDILPTTEEGNVYDVVTQFAFLLFFILKRKSIACKAKVPLETQTTFFVGLIFKKL